MDLLDLPGLESVRPLIDNNIRQYKIFAKVLEGQDFCPQCGSQQLHPFGDLIWG
jgi:hypothetical protein